MAAILLAALQECWNNAAVNSMDSEKAGDVKRHFSARATSRATLRKQTCRF